MQQFKLFCETESSKRVGIKHISELPPIEFISLCRYFKDELNSIISNDKVKINLKMDGCGVRFGTEHGNLYLESSYSGPQFNVGAFSKYTEIKKGVADNISKSYDDVLDKLQKNKKLKELLDISGAKVFAELLYTPNAKEISGKLQFLVIRYPKEKLGSLFSLIIYKVEHSSLPEIELIKQIKDLSTKEILFEDQKLDFQNIDVTAELDSFFEILKKYDDVEIILKSRKQKDQTLKNTLKTIIKEYQETISKKILLTKMNHKFLDEEFEGIVLYFENGQILKVVSDQYKTGKQEYNKEYKK